MNNDDENKDDQLFVYKLFGISTPRLLKARGSLRQKIGPVATISEAQILKAQYIVDQETVDFTPYIMDYIAYILRMVALMREDTYAREEYYNKLMTPIVQIKGQAAMFGNKLASVVSEKLLAFMEHYKRLDDDVLDILTVYCKIMESSCNSNTGEQDEKLLEEIDNALNRYKEKFKKNTGR